MKRRKHYYKRVPSELPPVEVTALLQRELTFHISGGVLNQIPHFDDTVKQRVFPVTRKITPLGPHTPNLESPPISRERAPVGLKQTEELSV